MRLEAIRIVADWLKDTANAGVNHYIPLVPLDTEDAGMTVPLIGTDNKGVLGVYDITRHPWVANKQVPPVAPALYIMGEGGVEAQGEPTPDGQIRATKSPLVVVARYLTANSDSVLAQVHGEYTLRAVLRSLRELMKNTNAMARTRNGILLEAMLDPVVIYPITETVGAFRVSGAIGINFHVRDVNPSF